MVSTITFLTILLSLTQTQAFHVFQKSYKAFTQARPLFTATSETIETETGKDTKTTKTIPSWEDLSSDLDAFISDQNLEMEDSRTPLLTLYRDTNGWCPFCERVWVYLQAKNIPYEERLINLQDKPQWYKDLVPTTLVPAIVIHDDKLNQTSEVEPQRRVVWESSQIMETLDELFNDNNPLILNNEEYNKAKEMNEELGMAGFQYIYASRDTSLTSQDIMQRKQNFIDKLNELDTELAKNGPFRMGEFTALDALMVPMLERWRYQLPIMNDIDILEGRQGIQTWFHVMENYNPYQDRVAGDEYSWTAVASYFLKVFNTNGTTISPEVTEAMERADHAAIQLENSFIENCNALDNKGAIKAKLLAADKILSNYEAIIQDCTSAQPKTQVHLPRASSVQNADVLLRYVVFVLLSSAAKNQTLDVVVADTSCAMLIDVDKSDTSVVAKTIARRLCVPRDMGALSGAFLRGVLAMIADILDR